MIGGNFIDLNLDEVHDKPKIKKLIRYRRTEDQKYRILTLWPFVHSGRRIPDNTRSSYSNQSFSHHSSSRVFDHAPGIYSWVELCRAKQLTGIK